MRRHALAAFCVITVLAGSVVGQNFITSNQFARRLDLYLLFISKQDCIPLAEIFPMLCRAGPSFA